MAHVRTLAWISSAAALALGCGDDPRPAPGEVGPDPVTAFVQGPEQHAFVGGVRFADGSSVDAVTVTPAPLRPGRPFRISFVADGPWASADLEVSVHPPRDASRQVAQGGVDAPPQEVPADPRRASIRVDPRQGEAEFVLAEPWHPQTAVILARRWEGDTAMDAVAGPRTHDGRAVLAMVEVERVPTRLVAPQASAPPTLDGVLDEAVWAANPPHGLGHSLDGERVEGVDTEVWVAWDAEALWVAARVADADITSSYTTQDDPLWKQEVFEVFVFGDARRRGYLELQVSPRGVTFDARFDRYREGDEGWDSAFRTAVAVEGTVDEGHDRDRGWTVEIAIPWAEICQNTEVTCPVRPGDELRLNLFRFERPRDAAPIGLALSPTLQPDFHAPENAAIVTLGGPA